MESYNPYRQSWNPTLGPRNDVHKNGMSSILSNRSLINLSKFGRNYNEFTYTNAITSHPNEDPNVDPFSYIGIRNKLQAISSEGINTAALQFDYSYKLELFKRYAREPEINYYVTKLANEIITYTKTKKFCDLVELDKNKYSESVVQRAKTIFDEMYNKLGFNIQSRAYDLCIDYLVEGYIVKEIVYDEKRKKIISFQSIDPLSIYPIIDDESGIKLWVQHPQSSNPRVILDSDIIYIAYSGASKYSDLSYVEPMIRPYNELKGLERAKINYNLLQAIMHKNINVPVGDLPRHMQEQEILTLMSMYNDNVQYDNYEGHTYINGSKDLPLSKTTWFADTDGNGVKVENESLNANDINEDITLNWFRNNFKQSTRFPVNKLDQSSGGGSVYNFGSDVTFDDYNFEQFIELLRSQFQDILIKPIYVQLCLEFPELINNYDLLNDLDLLYYGNDEILEAKRLTNLQAKIAIGVDILNNFKSADGDKPFLHPIIVATELLHLDPELLEKNKIVWKKYGNPDDAAPEGGGMDMNIGGGDLDTDMGGDMDMDMGGDIDSGPEPEPDAPSDDVEL